MDELWYKDAIIYSLDVETFTNSDNDGVGDFNGLISRLDYIKKLGVNCLWLLPFYPSPNRDNGYDVQDYYGIDQRLGNLGDFKSFISECKKREIEVIIDLVVNHTSIEHPWFQKARMDKNSPFRDYYIWSKNKPEKNEAGLTFSGEEDTMWSYDEEAGEYYLHRFYKEQPDLNTSNPNVREEILKIIDFWLGLGISGFRVDAAPILIETIGIEDPETEELFHVFDEMKSFLVKKNSKAVFLAEANVPLEKVPKYFKNRKRMDMLFNFNLNQFLFLAVASKKAEPLILTLGKIKKITGEGHWVNFIRHHDELNLEYLSEEERNFVFEVFAPDEDMRLYGHGIRRRLPPMLENNRKRIEMVYSLLFSLPGTPIIRYGDEIGMGDDLSLKGRDSVRTLMQWSSEKNAGFSQAPKEKLIRPVISEGEYSYKKLNVADAEKEADSLLHWFKRIIGVRKECPEIGRGNWKTIETDSPAVLAHICEFGGHVFLAVTNLGEGRDKVNLKDFSLNGFQEIFNDQKYEKVKDIIDISGYGYRWFRK